ncbi:MAG: glycosyl transferase family 2 [Candidatus Omnitrophica bacterium CG11_big_fil_rev_8_21_14_0_20_64_10]|nr:MAG: glycosyl transferase family 2 [Candidatus Omnitrophica bacterium CG11_big_fil_rev_8_21_14_0_20_64_10]
MTPAIDAVILTRNEAVNLPRCLDSLQGLCRKIFVVDSGSTDRTTEVAQAHGAEIIVHPFETHAKQWNWALKNLPLDAEWTLALDADQRVTPALREEILRRLPETPAEVTGWYLPRKQIFRGKWIRFGGYWPKYLLKLFRRGGARTDERELVDFRFYPAGQTACFTQPLIEENLKERRITFWLQKHVRFAELHAREEALRRSGRGGWSLQPAWRGTPDQRTLWLKDRIWFRFPLLARPFCYFPFRMILQLGILDGPTGWLYHFLHGFWYEWMIALRVLELLRQPRRDRRC